ncbi:MAG: hypothetical protein QXW62_06900 [Candidatus Methanomethylicaceae archaeon]|nr:hypothetical protein [Candidatus Verstraetearchaeota archaeon]
MSYSIFTIISTIRVYNPSFNLNQSHIEINVPVYLENRGFFPIEIITNCLGNEEKITIPIGASGIFPIKFSIKSDLIIENIQVFLTISIRPLISFSTNMTIPLSFQQLSLYQDFKLGEPTISIFNSTHILLNIPISFRNPSPISIQGYFIITIYDKEEIVGYGETNINVNSYSNYYGFVNIYLKNPWFDNQNYIFEGVSKNYTILISLPGFSMNQTQIINWPSIITNTTIGNPIITSYNSTHFSIIIPISFKNQAPFSLNGTLKGKILDSEGNIIGLLYDTKFNIKSEELFSINMQGHFKITETKIKLILIMETPYGIIEREIL